MSDPGATGPVAAGAGGNGASPRETEPLVDILPDSEAATRAVATLLASALVDAVRERGRADWATTGGSTVIGIYAALATSPLRELVPWDDVHVWWGDDRLVPRDHPLSNCLPFDDVLLDAAARAGQSGTGAAAIDIRRGAMPGIPLPVLNIHVMPINEALAEPPATTAAERVAEAYAAELGAAPMARDAAGTPILDVMLLGVGPDGHVLSVFPGSPLLDSPVLVSAVPAPEHVAPHVARVSLSPRFVTATRLPVVVLLGARKADIAAQVLTGPRDIRRYPAQLARRAGAAWFLDAAAASRLPGRDRGA